MTNPPQDAAKAAEQKVLAQAVERLKEALKEAATGFEEIRVRLINNLNEPERTAFWTAVHGRTKAHLALSTQQEPKPVEGDRQAVCEALAKDGGACP